MSIRLEVKALGPELEQDFYQFHSNPVCKGCYCVAWYVPTWEGWDKRTPEQNKSFRETLFKNGASDGFLFYVNSKPVGWIQILHVRTAPKLGAMLKLKTAVDAHAVGCMLLLPEYRKKGLSRVFLLTVLKHLKIKGIKKLLAIPKSEGPVADDEAWNGPAKLFDSLGFVKGEKVLDRVVYYKDLTRNDAIPAR